MRNSAFSTVTTNSRGVKSSLTRITLCSRGRSTLVLTLVLGLVTVSAMAQRYRLGSRLETRVFSMASLRWRMCADARARGASRALWKVQAGGHAAARTSGRPWSGGTKGPAVIAGLEISNIQAMIFHHHGRRALSHDQTSWIQRPPL